MQTEIIWRKQFKQSSAFNITPIADPFNPNCFYVGGGAEDDYGRYTRLRRLSFATGEEEASVSLKNNIKEIYFTPDTQFILVLSDDYLLRIQRENLLIIDIYDKNFPKTASCMAFNHQPIFFLMNSADKNLFAFNCIEGTKKRKVTKVEGCLSLDFEDNDHLLIYAPTAIQRYDLVKDKIEILFNTVPYRSILKDSKGNIYMNLCDNNRKLLSIIRKMAPDGTYKDYDLTPFNIKFDNFKLSKDEKYLFLMDCYEKTNTFCKFSLENNEIASKFTLPENERLLMFFEQQQLILTKEKDSFQMNFIGRKIIKE